MTEQEWLQAIDPQPMLDLLQGKATQRKLRLFAVACCRSVWHQLWGSGSYPTVAMAERYADQLASNEELQRAREDVVSQLELYPSEPVYDPAFWACGADMEEDAYTCSRYAAYASTRSVSVTSPDAEVQAAEVRAAELRSQCQFLRDVFGPLPFRPLPTIGPGVLQWNNGIVRRLAEEAYEHRLLPSDQLDPEGLSVLADAMEEAGADAELVEHLRQPEAIHVRGSWAVDLALGRE